MTTSPGSRSSGDVGEADRSHPLGRPVDACSEIGVRNSQPEGIGRVAALGGMCAWNNLGRNVVFADTSFRTLALFGETRFDDDELSQFDLDIHAIVELEGGRLVAVLNHLGLVRLFRASDIREANPAHPRHITPIRTVHFSEDVERTVVAWDRLVGSSPRSRRAGGVLVSEPVRGGGEHESLRVDVQLEECGEITALDSWSTGHDRFIALGGEAGVSLRPMVDGTIGPPRWESNVAFRPAGFMRGDRLLWVTGSERGDNEVGDYEWEQLGGGGFVGLDPRSGSTVVSGRFTRDLAWGNGGVAVGLARGLLCGVGRVGELDLFRAENGDWGNWADGNAAAAGATGSFTSRPLGIAHAAMVGHQFLYGWNRGGYRLYSCSVARMIDAAERLTARDPHP